MYYGVRIKLDSSDGVYENLLYTYDLILCADVSDGAPPVRTEMITIAGTDGSIDVSEVLTGGPLYNNRTLEFGMCMAQTSDEEFSKVYSIIKNKYHGRICRIIMPWNTSVYYIGRVSIGEKGSYGDTQFRVTVDAKPYLYHVLTNEKAGL